MRLTVSEDMSLRVEPDEAGFDGEHRARTFRIVQPEALDGYTRRAEFWTANRERFFRLVDGDEFDVTHEMTREGVNRVQLVYFDGDELIRKTSIASFRIGPSINAVQMLAGESDGDSGDIGTDIVQRLDALEAETAARWVTLDTVEDRSAANAGQIAALQAEATAKWVTLNTVEVRSLSNLQRIEALEAALSAFIQRGPKESS